MRVECESCHELQVASFAIDGSDVCATCPACGHAMRARAAPAVPAGPEAPACPKCGAPRRDDATACATCGLAVSRMESFREALEAAVPGEVREAWARTAEHWSDAARHDELLRLVASHRCYAWAAGRYRTRKSDETAVRQLERLRRAAEATLLASATARDQAAARPYRASTGVLAILIVAILVGLVYALVLRQPALAPSRTLPVPARPLAPGHPVSPSTIK